ncbi:MAG: Asp-tRNA(Asn)/Glu-tRNA(Gln) amidotransferase subunit GatB [Holophagaceae bacterium]
MKPGYEAVIGLEVHVQLRTRTKMFCGCPNRYGAPPNSLTCPVCLGLPGALPVLNGEAVQMGLALGLALSARIPSRSSFYRKQYFYPDLPKGYQITQGPVALAEEGALDVPGDPAVRGDDTLVRMRIERAHLEEDAGKSHHDRSGSHTLVDLNRAGVPLLEIVGAPDLRSPQEASDALKALHRLVTFLGICDGNLEEGSLRCDANVSVRPAGDPRLGSRVEIKNLNSFRFLRQALEHEITRHIGILEAGGVPARGTRGWSPEAGVTRPRRSKEDALDYRFFPEPDLPELEITEAEAGRVRASMPELPWERERRLREEHGLTPHEAATLLQSPAFADTYEAAARASGHPRATANWMLGEVSRVLNARGCDLEALGLEPVHLGTLVRLVETGVLPLKLAREEVFPALLAREGDPEAIVAARGLVQVSDRGAVEALVKEVLAANPGPVAQWRGGNPKLRGFLVGQVLKAGQGRLDPKVVNEVMDDVFAE